MAGVATGARRSSLMSMAKATSYDSDIFGRRQSGSRVREYDAQIHPDGASSSLPLEDQRSRARRDSIIEIEKVNAHLSRMRGGPLVISPDDRWVAKWDCCTSIALLFTALFTPYELSLIHI